MANINVPAGKGMRGGKRAKTPMKTLLYMKTIQLSAANPSEIHTVSACKAF